MARQNVASTRTAARTEGPVRLEVLRRVRLSPSYARVTLGGGDVEAFEPLGHDQWFRLFLPVADSSLDQVPDKLTTLTYVRWLASSRSTRPVIRSYTVRAHRDLGPSGGPEIDVDFVLHGSAEDGTAGPASAFAETCTPGDRVALIDEGTTFRLADPADPAGATGPVLLVADETAVPAALGILASLPPAVTGTAVLEVPTGGDRDVLAAEVEAPAGVEVRWVVRTAPEDKPGTAALAAATAVEVDDPAALTVWTAGEQALPTGLRRHLVGLGVPKDRISFVGYWRQGRAAV